ncbi:MAG: MG2 domain-containing protein [Verrucomicrobiota bacterium]
MNPDEPKKEEDNLAVDGALKEYARTGGPGDDESFIKDLKRRITRKDPAEGREPDWPWLFSFNFWKVAAAVAFLFVVGAAFQTYRVHNAYPDPTEVYIYTQPRIEPGEPIAVRAFVREAREYKPLANASVRLTLSGKGFNERGIAEEVTDENGVCQLTAEMPEDLEEGDFLFRAEVQAETGKAEAQQTVTITRSYRTMLSTDKPLYQPGQTIHMRALSMETDTLLPATGRPVSFEVRDAKGNKVFAKNIETSDFGIAAADFKLANQVNEGSYTIAVNVNGEFSERTVNVQRYTLPRYKIDLATSRGFYGPRDVVAIDLDVNYTFGKPTTGADVVIHAEQFLDGFREFQKFQGKTDSGGRISFELPLRDVAFAGQPLHLGDAFVRLRAVVTDAAGETREATKQFQVTTKPLRVEIFPESGDLVQGIENVVYVVTTYADGTPAQARVVTGGTSVVQTNEMGIGKYKFKPNENTTTLSIDAETPDGARLTTRKELRLQETDKGILLRTDRAIYRQGETANISVLSATASRRVFLDVVKNGRSYATTAIDVEARKGSYALDLPMDLAGTIQIQAYAILPSGDIARDTKVITVHRAQQLQVEAKLDADTYKPAEKAIIDFLVKSSDGDPVEAALSLAAVDEAVFALNSMRPGMEEMYFLIQEELLKPRYQITVEPRADFTRLPEDIEPNVEEANVVAAAASIGAGEGPADAQGETIHQRWDRVYQDRSDHRKWLLQLLAGVPFVGLLCMFGFLGAYVVSRIWFQPRGLEQDLHVKTFRQRMLVMWLIILGSFILIPICMAAATTVIYNQTTLVIISIVLCISATVALAVSAGELGRLPHADRNLILFSKAIRIVPAIFGLACATIYGLMWAQIFRYDSVPESMAITLTLISLGLVMLTMAFVFFLRGALSRKRSVGQNVGSLGIGIGTAALAGLALNTFTCSVGGMNAMAEAASGGADEAMLDMMFAEAPRMAMPNSADFGAEQESASSTSERPRIRRFFPETLLWAPQLVTDENGRGKLEVNLADSITTWRLSGSAVTRGGQMSSFQEGIRVFQDFFIDIDFPTQLTQNDEVAAPIAIFNYLDEPQTIQLEAQTADWFEFVGDTPTKSIEIAAGEIASTSFRIRALKPGRHALTVTAIGTSLSDAVERSVRVEPDGVRVENVINDRIGDETLIEFEIPENAVEGGNDLYLKIYPGAFSQVVEGMDSIFRMPHGCFEQTSSTTYPNVLVLDYLQRTKQTKPEIEMKALDFIAQGYQRLLSYEVDGGGYDWYGRPPANVNLTAYGLMEFSDMSEVYDVDQDMMRRTENWLLAQCENDGSFRADWRGGDKLRSTAYVAWALAESGVDKRLKPSLDYLAKELDGSVDPYALGLAANAFASAGDSREARQLLKQLDDVRQSTEEGLVFWAPEGTGATYSMGDSFAVETTAIIVQAMLNTQHDTPNAHKALEWLITKRDSRGTWMSTQATVQVMRALLLGSEAAGKLEGDVQVEIVANGGEASNLTITEETSEVFHLVSLTEHAKSGANQIVISTDVETNLAYQVVAVHYDPRGMELVEAQEILEIDTEYSTTRLAEDDLLTVKVTLKYHRPTEAPMTLVDLGIPPGFEIEAPTFQKLLADGVIERFEPKGRQVTLYFNSIPGGGQAVEFEYAIRAIYPVKAQTPASVAYQYYEPEVRDESETVLLTVE